MVVGCRYPKELRFKLLERKAKILSFFKQHSSARETYKATLKALDDAKVDAQKKMKIQKDVQQARRQYLLSHAHFRVPFQSFMISSAFCSMF